MRPRTTPNFMTFLPDPKAGALEMHAVPARRHPLYDSERIAAHHARVVAWRPAIFQSRRPGPYAGLDAAHGGADPHRRRRLCANPGARWLCRALLQATAGTRQLHAH